MCDFCKKCSEGLEEGISLAVFMQSRPTASIAEDLAEVLMQRQEAGNVFILAAAKALENNSGDAVAIISATTDLMVELAEVDQTVFDLIEYVDEAEACCCDDCFCCGCPYANECGGDCFFEDEDFFAQKEEIKEEPKEEGKE